MSKNNNDTKKKNLSSLKKNPSKNFDENGKKCSINDKSLKKSGIFSSPVSIEKKEINKKISSKSPIGNYAKQTNTSKIYSKSNYLNTYGNYLLTDETVTNGRVNTAQAVEIFKSPSMKNSEDTEFIKNKYKYLLENLRKPKNTPNN